jgi:serine/threonine-protein kinase
MTFTGDRSGVLRSRSGANADSATPASAAPSGGPRPGDILELGAEATRYKILRSLGTGGTAEVFLGLRLGPADIVRPVALKCILTGLDVDEPTRRAFVYEARLASKLRDPNIAEAYDLALVEDRYYLVLEYVDGVTLRKVLRAARIAERRLSEGFCCYVAASVAEGLHHAHTLADEHGTPLGIVHRDVTAVNVMVARTGAVKLLDFGVALARMEGRERTQTGQRRGTFVYASPEQALDEKLDGRSDLFSLGVVLVEMLTGVRVFDAETDVAMARKIAECRAEDVRTATAAIPRKLAAICAKALARRPGDRFQDGATFSHALREYLTARGITYSREECAAELQSLGLLAAAPDGPGAVAAADDVSNASAADAGSSVSAAPDRATAQPRRRTRRRRTVASVAVFTAVAAIVVAGSSSKLLWSKDRAIPEPSTVASAPPIAEAPSAPEAAPPSVVRTGETPAPNAARRDVRTEPEAIVRPKRRAGGARSAAAEQVKPLPPAEQLEPSPPVARPERAPVRTTFIDFLDRPTVASPRATLPRGTLVRAKLLRTLTGPSPGRVEAAVTEDVAADGVVLVPSGSTVSCAARAPADGRVPLSCDSITTSDGVLRFTALAVGEGQRVGLRLLDDEIAAGTPFVVYVSEPAMVR